MNALAAALDALFADSNVGRDTVYTPAGGEPLTVRIVPRRTDTISEFGEARVWSETIRLDVRVSEVAEPRPGDSFEIDGEAFVVQGEPTRDREQLVWTVELRPA